uniref:Uncharacterized protein n=1 Tax=Quercus lobata TaxID=97700 RepID=A0A7N2LE35_QUELO
MEIIEIEEVRILDFPVGRHRSVSQALPRKRKTKKSKRCCAREKEVRSSTKFHDPLNFLILTLLGVLGASLRGSGISPLKEHGEIIFFIIMAIVIYCIAFLGMKLGPQNVTYLPMFNFICVTCAFLACELFASILVDPLRLFIINLCGILVELIRHRWYKLIPELFCHATNKLVHGIQHTSQAFINKFGTKKQDQDDIV